MHCKEPMVAVMSIGTHKQVEMIDIRRKKDKLWTTNVILTSVLVILEFQLPNREKGGLKKEI